MPSKTSFLSCALLCTKLALANQIKMASISDIHLMPMYYPYGKNDAYCWPPSDPDTPHDLDPPAYFGQFLCDPPTELVEVMFSKLQADHPDLQVIFAPGDFVAHAIAKEWPPTPDYPTANYGQLLSITEQLADLFTKYFPDAVVLPTQGNNDTKYHY